MLVALLLVVLAACGTTTSCRAGHSFMGCSKGAQARFPHPAPGHVGVTPPVPGCKITDTSSYQGHPDFAAAAGSICANISKAGEGYSEDPDFAWAVGDLRRLHIPWGGYWFIRGCSEGPPLVSVLRSVGFRGDRDALRPVLDMEVGSAYGCAVPIARAVHAAFGVWPIIYTAPGTWPGGSSGGLDAWEADYSLGTLARLPFAARILAWQRYSPPFTRYYVPGLGYGDVSIDLHGMAKAFAFPKPIPKPTRAQIAKWMRARNASQRGLVRADRALKAHRCHTPYRGHVCVSEGRIAATMRHRIGWYDTQLKR